MKLKLSPQQITIIAIAVIAVGVTLFVAATLQQNYRLTANDPQIQLAEDAASNLAKGQQPSAVVGPGNIDASNSLAPFVTVYSGGKPFEPLATSGYFGDNKTLSPPAGVFDNARARGEERFTWQTIEGQREAAVLVYADSPQPVYVLAARNLREVESREDQLRLLTFLALLGIAVVAAVASLLLNPRFVDRLSNALKKAYSKP